MQKFIDVHTFHGDDNRYDITHIELVRDLGVQNVFTGEIDVNPANVTLTVRLETYTLFEHPTVEEVVYGEHVLVVDYVHIEYHDDHVQVVFHGYLQGDQQ